MSAQELGDFLAPINATLNLSSAVLLVFGYRFIRSGDRVLHRKCMLGAVSASALFLVFYVLRFSLTGSHSFVGPPPVRTFYLTVLFSHMVLAVIVLPMVLRLLWLAKHERFTDHRRLARWTFPLWLYVSMTGLLVYTMLYHIFGYE